MEWIQCPACNKRIKNLKLHYRSSHPDLDVPDLRKLDPVPDPEQPKERVEPLVDKQGPVYKEGQEQPKQEPAAEAPQSDLLQKLKAFGIDPNDIIIVFTPLIETSVVKTLEKMQLGEAINKKIGEVETKLSGQIQETLKPLQQAVTSQPSGDTQPQNTQLRDNLLAAVAQKFLSGGNSGGSLEQITKTLEMASNVANVIMKPYVQGQQDTMRQLTDLLKLSAGLGLTPEQRQGVIGGLANQGTSGQ